MVSPYKPGRPFDVIAVGVYTVCDEKAQKAWKLYQVGQMGVSQGLSTGPSGSLKCLYSSITK